MIICGSRDPNQSMFHFRPFTAAVAAILLASCANNATGQKGKTVVLNSMIDSVSYGIGMDIGSGMKQSGLDSLKVDIMAQGLQDGLDSACLFTGDEARQVVQQYMMALQRKQMAKEDAQAQEELKRGEAFLAENSKKSGVVTTASGLQYQVISKGTGPMPKRTDKVSVHYTGTLIDGTVFDSSVERGEPVEFGVDQVIPGWTEGLQLMPQGSKWKLFIPAGLAYGPRGTPDGSIPGNSALVFEVELLAVTPNP
jgi:FKBP-type peptidyl-prolyl cis-trans isomerase FklB